MSERKMVLEVKEGGGGGRKMRRRVLSNQTELPERERRARGISPSRKNPASFCIRGKIRWREREFGYLLPRENEESSGSREVGAKTSRHSTHLSKVIESSRRLASTREARVALVGIFDYENSSSRATTASQQALTMVKEEGVRVEHARRPSILDLSQLRGDERKYEHFIAQPPAQAC